MSEDNYLITKNHSMIGITEHGKGIIYRMAIGDLMTFYISKKHIDAPRTDITQRVRKVRGIARVIGEAFMSDEGIWRARQDEVFPHRRQVEFLSDVAINAEPVLEGLSYVTNSRYWALPLRRGYVEITEQDFDKIQAALGT